MDNGMIVQPLRVMRIRRQLINHTFGMVRTGSDGKKKAHQGWDLYAPSGTPIYAIADGEIVSVLTSGDYGKMLVLKFWHDERVHHAAYAHLSQVHWGKACVERGTILGLTGTTGNAKGMKGEDEHLHFEIRTTESPGRGLGGRTDPGFILGFGPYSCQEVAADDGTDGAECRTPDQD